MRHPGDVSGVEALFDAGLPPGQVVAILGKTEGNGCVNDFTRAYAVQALQHMLARRGGRPLSSPFPPRALPFSLSFSF